MIIFFEENKEIVLTPAGSGTLGEVVTLYLDGADCGAPALGCMLEVAGIEKAYTFKKKTVCFCWMLIDRFSVPKNTGLQFMLQPVFSI